MNLSNIGDDTTMKEEHGNFLPLSRNNVALTLAALIGQACPNLKSINLSKNKLRFMDYLTTLAIRCPRVSTLDLSSNYVENISEIEKLWPWKNTMTELSLEQNPLCKRFREGSAYVNAIRRLFPKLKRLSLVPGINLDKNPTGIRSETETKLPARDRNKRTLKLNMLNILDGVELPPAFKTGIEEELSSTNVALPPIKVLLSADPSFYFNDQFKAICTRFIDEFFAIFDDSDKQKREQLFQAYDEEAMFTLTAHNLTEESNRMKSECWSEFVRDSHNIKCMSLWERHRSKMVHKGRLSIISYFVRDYPVVKHDRNTFVVDVSFGTENLICVNVSGLCTLPLALSTAGSTRFFTRVFLLIPKNDGVAVVNEQLFCSTVTPIQENAYRNIYDSSSSISTIGAGLETLLGTANPSVMEQPSTSSASPHLPHLNGSSTPVADSVNKRRMMIEEFSAKSKMKLHWAEKCLEDCDWNFENAAYTFSEMQKQNCIPAEAFL
uniref:Nuclear RNA export factor 1 n=1 Tax=Romanomermis culicivorax TaxID=13658 RepID=A0A915J4T1_ROMCU